ncbi:hypothetical protein GCM10023331_00400 [Algivirga pacifica]|uniref:T9SS type A sorting domain-containing protein n=2 Tax=Algivirga pacifica TaxID=1162670 RepID=A0ABP9D1I8_9BACT
MVSINLLNHNVGYGQVTQIGCDITVGSAGASSSEIRDAITTEECRNPDIRVMGPLVVDNGTDFSSLDGSNIIVYPEGSLDLNGNELILTNGSSITIERLENACPNPNSLIGTGSISFSRFEWNGGNLGLGDWFTIIFRYLQALGEGKSSEEAIAIAIEGFGENVVIPSGESLEDIICAGYIDINGLGNYSNYIKSFSATLDDEVLPHVVTFDWETFFTDDSGLTATSVSISGGDNVSASTYNAYTGSPSISSGGVTFTDTDGSKITDIYNHYYKISTTVTYTGGDITDTDVCSCQYTISSGTGLGGLAITALPVELAYFSGNRDNGNVVLQWATTYEENNDYFEVQRSIDGKNFQEIAQIEGLGKGEYEEITEYTYTDEKAPQGLIYYRLKQVDIDGKFEYYNLVINPSSSQRSISVENYSGNPHKGGDLQLQMYSPVTQQVYMVLVNQQGQVTYERRISIKGGYTRILVPEQQFSKGLSILKIITANKQQTIKLINP